MIDSDKPVSDLVSDFIKYQELEIGAQEREDIRAANQHFKRMYKALKQLAQSSAGRDALESLMHHELPEVRLRAAGQVLSWSSEKAIPILGRLAAEWRPKDPRKGYVAVAYEACGWLYDHFGVKDYDRDKLIEPMLKYGVAIPKRGLREGSTIG